MATHSSKASRGNLLFPSRGLGMSNRFSVQERIFFHAVLNPAQNMSTFNGLYYDAVRIALPIACNSHLLRSVEPTPSPRGRSLVRCKSYEIPVSFSGYSAGLGIPF